MNHDELAERIEELKKHRLQLQNLRKISEDGLFSLQKRMAEIEAEMLKPAPIDEADK